VTTSSQTEQPGALPPELPPERTVLSLSEALAVTASEAAAAVIDATMAETGGATGEELAAAEQRAGILFDAAHVEAAVTAAAEQARAEMRAELTDARQQLAAIAGAHRQRDAVLRLCEGRRGDDLLLVSAVATAVECGTTALDGLPMRLTWTRTVQIPKADAYRQETRIDCASSYGGRAELVIEDAERQALASLLDAHLVRDIHASCPTLGCGSDAPAFDEDDPSIWGWTLAQVAGTDTPARWYCTPACVSTALVRAGEELAAIDQAAADMITVDRAEHPDAYADEDQTTGGEL